MWNTKQESLIIFCIVSLSSSLLGTDLFSATFSPPLVVPIMSSSTFTLLSSSITIAFFIFILSFSVFIQSLRTIMFLAPPRSLWTLPFLLFTDFYSPSSLSAFDPLMYAQYLQNIPGVCSKKTCSPNFQLWTPKVNFFFVLKILKMT